MANVTSVHNNTKWNIIPTSEVSLCVDPKHPNSLTHWVLSHDPSSTKLYPCSYAAPEKLRKDLNIAYFLIDHEDLMTVYELEKEFSYNTYQYWGDSFSSILQFTHMIDMVGMVAEESRRKKMYLRTIPAVPMGDNTLGESRVFVEEISAMIPILREHQGNSFEKPEAEQQKISNRFNPANNSGLIQTITLSQLKNLLEEYDIDKSLLTLVDDPTYLIGWKSLEKTGAPFKMLSHSGAAIISKEQGTLHLFQSLICGVYWDGVPTKEKVQIANIIHACATLGQGIYLWYEAIVSSVIQIRKAFRHIYADRKATFDVMYHKVAPTEIVPYSEYEEITKHFHLPLYTFSNFQVPNLEIWSLRPLLIIGWIHSFVKDDARMKMFILSFAKTSISGLLLAIPENRRTLIADITVSGYDNNFINYNLFQMDAVTIMNNLFDSKDEKVKGKTVDSTQKKHQFKKTTKKNHQLTADIDHAQG
ncbi:hypothetical protein CRE_19956 [Caenorhabditis remanei]|uniref:Uncharacterized protein n=1 Tax=Caenorhabditis remanei TaxID=31234 RepID=E3N8I1_CAERE|nr:hypothetical protein CRE_19956 [Caenorhabditis remanei]